MPEVKITKHVAHRWADMFKLVLDVESYPVFVPYCQQVKLVSRRAESSTDAIIVSRMTVGLSALRVSYSNRTHGDFAGRVIKVEAIDGPFRFLRVVWRFTPRADHRTRIDFSVNFEFSSLILAAVASRVLDSMFGEMVDAFERRADHLFGRDET
jgi:coenzyme Q-binding protein COQ10